MSVDAMLRPLETISRSIWRRFYFRFAPPQWPSVGSMFSCHRDGMSLICPRRIVTFGRLSRIRTFQPSLRCCPSLGGCLG